MTRCRPIRPQSHGSSRRRERCRRARNSWDVTGLLFIGLASIPARRRSRSRSLHQRPLPDATRDHRCRQADFRRVDLPASTCIGGSATRRAKINPAGAGLHSQNRRGFSLFLEYFPRCRCRAGASTSGYQTSAAPEMAIVTVRVCSGSWDSTVAIAADSKCGAVAAIGMAGCCGGASAITLARSVSSCALVMQVCAPLSSETQSSRALIGCPTKGGRGVES